MGSSRCWGVSSEQTGKNPAVEQLTFWRGGGVRTGRTDLCGVCQVACVLCRKENGAGRGMVGVADLNRVVRGGLAKVMPAVCEQRPGGGEGARREGGTVVTAVSR